MESIKTLARKMGVSPATLNSWEKRLKLSLPRTSRGKLENADSALEVFQLVKSLREEGSGFETIIRRLEPEQSPKKTGIELEQSSETLAEKYAQAMYTLGQKELELKHLLAENQSLKLEIEQVSALSQEGHFKDIIRSLEDENRQLQVRLKQALQQQLNPFN